MKTFVLWVALGIALFAPPEATAVQIDSASGFSVRNFFGDILFNKPVHVQKFPVPVQGSSYTLLVVSQTGLIQVVHRTSAGWDRDDFDMVTVSGVNGPGNDDGGLLGFAFHPDYARNRKYYVLYVAPYSLYASPGHIVLEERQADADLLSRSAQSPVRRMILLKKFQTSHNGGTLKFGKDGYLYTAIGDGGSGAQNLDLAQNKKSLHGKMLRIDVDGPDAFPGDTLRNYAYPSSNPFVGDTSWLPEIWAYGLRSPWKWDFHPVTGEIWLGDIGQSSREELSIVPAGGNMGWKFREGNLCFSPLTACPSEGLVPPLVDFERAQAQSITAGSFYYGGAVTTELDGTYFFADYMKGSIWTLRRGNDSVAISKIAQVNHPVSVNADESGRLFVVSIASNLTTPANTGIIYIVESPKMVPESTTLRPIRPTLSSIKANPDLFEFRSIAGKRLDGPPKGIVLVRPKLGPQQSFSVFAF